LDKNGAILDGRGPYRGVVGYLHIFVTESSSDRVILKTAVALDQIVNNRKLKPGFQMRIRLTSGCQNLTEQVSGMPAGFI
jgi:hypothetical protein